jgi:Tol biopolymer transport system component
MTAYDGGITGDTVPFTLSGSTPTALQPQCATANLRYCLTLDYFYDGTCPFGKCYLSSGGLILGYDGFNLNLMTYRIGTANSGKDLPIHQPRYAEMNDKEQVAYDQLDNADHRHVYVYDTKTATQKVLPALAGNVCDYQLVSQNNVGSVLGFASNCTKAPSQSYVLWDAAGVHNITSSLAANTYFSISLLGVNDNGVILAELLKVNAQGVLEYHWGFVK